jgi:tetratricopeptide (TPR) repeat protein
MGDVYRRLGFLMEARQAYTSALRDADEATDGAAAVTPRIGLAQVSRQEGHLEQAMEELAAAREVADRLRLHNLLAQVTNLRGEIARYSGDLEEAEACYREAAALFRAFENSHAVYASLNLGVVLALRGDYAEGRLQMQQLLDDLLRRDEAPEKIAYSRAVLLPCTAAAADWLAYAEHHDELVAFLERSGARDEDIAQLARRAGTLALSRGELDVARQALGLALEQYRDLGKEDKAAEVEAELARL